MQRGVLRLMSREDVCLPTVIVLATVLVGVLLSLATRTPAIKLAIAVLTAAGVGYTVFRAGWGLVTRLRRLRDGHCPYPLCHGAVHHSELAPKGFVICPTCRRKWPDLPGIRFRATVRDHM
jgi:hypothetical protein